MRSVFEMLSDQPSSHASPGFPGHRSRTSTLGSSFVQDRQTYEREIEFLHNHLKATQDVLQRVHLELEESQVQVAEDAGVIGHLNQKLAELEDLVQKQKMTISNQSKTISDPRLIRRHQSPGGLLPVTPHPQGLGLVPTPFESPYSNRSQFSVGTFDPPPTYDSAMSNSVAPRMAQQSPAPFSQPQSFGYPPVGLTPMWDPMAWANGGSYPIAYFDIATCIAEFSSRFRELWAKTELFGQVHANTPNVYRDSQLDRQVKNYVMSVSDKHGASSLLGSSATRFFLVAKAINAFLVHDVLKITVVKGFDTAADSEIGNIKKQLFPDTPAPVRHLMIVAMAAKIQSLKGKPDFFEYFQQRVYDHCRKLWDFIAPLANNETISQAWTDLSAIVSDAKMLALDMYSVPFEYKSDFPSVNEKFNPATMVNCDAFVLGDSQVLANSDSRVRLGITPVTRVRDNADPSNVVKQVSFGHVLLRPAAH